MSNAHGRDIHSALKTESVGQASGQGVQFMLLKLQYGKDEIGYSVHAKPSSFSSAGLQITDFLSHLGFVRQRCAYISGQEAYCRGVRAGFDISHFGPAFERAFAIMEEAEHHLEACGYSLEQPEGWGYFLGKSSGTRHRARSVREGNGHTSPQSKTQKTSEDDFFSFAMTFIGRGPSKGWVFHYRPKHLPLSAEVRSVIEFLGLRSFRECPVFDFDSCLWRLIERQERQDHLFGGNAGFVDSSFDAHTTRFSPAVRSLIEANTTLRPFGLEFLPIQPEQPEPSQRVRATNAQPPAGEQQGSAIAARREYQYDVAISFAGTERPYAERLAEIIRDAGFRVFYDDYYPDQLWGKDLVVFFDEIYRKRSLYCVIFTSAEYCSRLWTNHERRSAQARMLEARGKEYILPIKTDDSELPGMPPTVGSLALGQYDIDQIGALLIKKLMATG